MSVLQVRPVAVFKIVTIFFAAYNVQWKPRAVWMGKYWPITIDEC